MRLVSTLPAATRRTRWLVAAAATVAVTAAVLLAIRPGGAVTLWVGLVAALLAHLAGRRASDCSVLAELDGLSLADLAAPLAPLAARSRSPLLDLSRIRAAGGGVVMIDGTPRVVTERRVEQLDVDLVVPGRWGQLALPVRQLDATTPVDRLRRLPDEDEVWVISGQTGTSMVSGDGLRAAAATARSGRRHDRARRPAVTATRAQTSRSAHPVARARQ